MDTVESVYQKFVKTRAVDPHSFFVDPDPAVFLNTDPDADPDPKPALQIFLKITL